MKLLTETHLEIVNYQWFQILLKVYTLYIKVNCLICLVLHAPISNEFFKQPHNNWMSFKRQWRVDISRSTQITINISLLIQLVGSLIFQHKKSFKVLASYLKLVLFEVSLPMLYFQPSQDMELVCGPLWSQSKFASVSMSGFFFLPFSSYMMTCHMSHVTHVYEYSCWDKVVELFGGGSVGAIWSYLD